MRIVDRGEQGASLLDYGCGYGGLLSYLQREKFELRYTGYDISVEMLDSGKKEHGESENIQWINDLGPWPVRAGRASSGTPWGGRRPGVRTMSLRKHAPRR
jgi:SAM-dependent methyltransferase